MRTIVKKDGMQIYLYSIIDMSAIIQWLRWVS